MRTRELNCLQDADFVYEASTTREYEQPQSIDWSTGVRSVSSMDHLYEVRGDLDEQRKSFACLHLGTHERADS